MVSWQPRALLLHGFLTDAEADHMVGLAAPSLERSRVIAQNGSGVLDSVRTSSGTFLPKGADAVVAGVEARVAAVTHLPVSHAENLQILRCAWRAGWAAGAAAAAADAAAADAAS